MTRSALLTLLIGTLTGVNAQAQNAGNFEYDLPDETTLFVTRDASGTVSVSHTADGTSIQFTTHYTIFGDDSVDRVTVDGDGMQDFAITLSDMGSTYGGGHMVVVHCIEYESPDPAYQIDSAQEFGPSGYCKMVLAPQDFIYEDRDRDGIVEFYVRGSSDEDVAYVLDDLSQFVRRP